MYTNQQLLIFRQNKFICNISADILFNMYIYSCSHPDFFLFTYFNEISHNHHRIGKIFQLINVGWNIYFHYITWGIRTVRVNIRQTLSSRKGVLTICGNYYPDTDIVHINNYHTLQLPYILSFWKCHVDFRNIFWEILN